MSRVLVCGSRDYSSDLEVDWVLGRMHMVTPISCIIHGGARGADSLAQEWANKWGINTRVVFPDWSLGKKAGPLRNIKMLKEHLPDQVVAFWDGKSPGTRHMIQIAEEANIPVKVIKI